MDTSFEDFCLSLPKIELHAHLNGSLSDKILPLLGCPYSDICNYQKLRNIPIGQRNLENVFKTFAIAHKATSSSQTVYLATLNLIKEFAADNVIYLELRTTPRNEEGMSAENYIESVIKAIQDSTNRILVKLILSLNRQHSLEECTNNLNLILKKQSEYPDIIKGIDLSGNPIHGSFHDLKHLFKRGRNNNLFTTIHCGEVVNSKEIHEILEFRPERIGHACYLHPNYNGCIQNWNLLKELRLPTEICLTSNIVTGTVDIYENHHVQEWIKDNLPFSLNTDDKGIFNTSLSQEFQIAKKFFKFSAPDLWKISMNSIEDSFANAEEKIYLKMKLEDWKFKNYKFFSQ